MSLDSRTHRVATVRRRSGRPLGRLRVNYLQTWKLWKKPIGRTLRERKKGRERVRSSATGLARRWRRPAGREGRVDHIRVAQLAIDRHGRHRLVVGVDFLLLEGPADTAAYWETTLPEEGRAAFPWPGLLAAPALVVVYADADRYVERYAEADKAASGLGGDAGDWPVPYWYVDAAFAALALQLLVVGKGLGCCFFGLFEHERAVAERFGVPSGRRAVGVVAVGHPATAGQRPSGSTTRGRRDLDEVLHRGHWGAADERPTGAAG